MTDKSRVWSAWEERLCRDCAGQPDPQAQSDADALADFAAELEAKGLTAAELIASGDGLVYAMVCAEPSPLPCTKCGTAFIRWTDDDY